MGIMAALAQTKVYLTGVMMPTFANKYVTLATFNKRSVFSSSECFRGGEPTYIAQH
jgi:hypothetical protein